MLKKDVRYQVLATFCCNVLSVGYGCVCGWPSASLPVLLDKDSTILDTGPMSVEQSSWVSSLMCAGGFFGNLFFVWFTERFGRKSPLIIAAVFQIVGWLLIMCATTPTYLYVARFLSGFSGGGVFVLVPMFVTEIADDRVRGVLNSLLVFSCNIGFLFAFVLGNYFAYATVPFVIICVPVLFLVGFVFLPESPQYLVRKGRDADAAKALRFYRNVRHDSLYGEDSTELKGELDKLKALYQHIGSAIDEEGHLRASDVERIGWADFCTPLARRAMLLGIGLVSLNQFCGVFAMLNYTATIFAEAGSDMTPNMAAIVIGVIQLAGAYFSTLLVERAGRKFLLAFSALGTAVGLGSLGAYTHLKESGVELQGFGWLPLLSFSFVVFIASWGVLTLPFVVIAEIMPEKIRASGTSICMLALWAFAFTMVKYFPILKQLMGMYGSMYLFTGCCLAGAAFVIGMLPETKGKSIDEIMALLIKR